MGLRLLRPASGLVQLSSADICYQLSTWGSLLLTDSGTVQPQPIVVGEVTVSGTNPILAFRASNGVPVSIKRVSASGNNYTYRFEATSGAPVGIIYWVFDVAGSAGSQLTGPRMRVWTELGVKTFDSWAFAMRLSTTQNGPNVAVIQSTYANNWEFISQGNTNDGFYIIESRRSQSAARFNADGSITTGILQYSSQIVRVNPANGYPQDEFYGQSVHTFVDIEDLPSATMPSGSSLAVGTNTGLREVSTGSNNPVTTVTPEVTATVTGGTAPYTLKWQFIDGSPLVVPNGADNALSFSTKVVNQSPGSTLEARYQLRANDATRVGYSDPVTFRHSVPTLDLTPDVISNIAAVSGTSNDPDVYFGYDYRRITGISGPITLRVERYDFTGDADIVEVLVATSPDAVNWTNLTPFNAKGTGQAYIDLNVTNGTYVGWKIRVVTASGRKTANMRVVIWNLSDASGSVQINSTPGNALVVDNDDNYNIDQTPDAFSLANQTVVSNDFSAYTAGVYFTITGITRAITLRFTRDSLVESGMTSSRQTVIGKSTDGGAIYSESILGTVPGASVSLTANPGDKFFIKGYLSTNSGRATASWRNIITNQTTGVQLATANVSLVVDDDNNYNVADVVPDAISPQNTNVTTAGNALYDGAGSTFTITGINTSITLRFANTLSSTSGNVSSRQMVIGRNRGGSLQEWFISVPNGTVDVQTQNGDQFYVKGYLETSSGTASSQWSWTVRNQSSGGTQIGSASKTMTVDNDNNYNVADVVMDYPGLSGQDTYHSSANAFNGGATFTVTGINAPITIRFNSGDLSISGNAYKVEMIAGRTTSGYTEVFRAINGAAIDLTANNGDQFFVKGYVESQAGVRTTVSWNWFLTNVTANQYIGSANVRQTTNA